VSLREKIKMLIFSILFLRSYFSTAIPVESFPKTEILIVMRSTKSNLNSRVQLALDTWSPKALAQVNFNTETYPLETITKSFSINQLGGLAETALNQAWE